jgi:DNA modification methylase
MHKSSILKLKRKTPAPAGNLQIQQIDISRLRTSPKNARLHSKSQIHQIAGAIREFSFINPVIVDQRNQIVAGHGRFEAAKLLGLASIPIVRVEHLNKHQLRAYALADNKIAQNASWDHNLLAVELEELSKLDLGFDLELTGFSTPEIDVLLEETSPSQENFDEVPPLAKSAVSQQGDVWQLGDHLLFCGDALDDASYQALLNTEKVRLVFADPPYNVKIQGHVSGLGKARHREFAMAAGEMSDAEFRSFLSKFMRLVADHSLNGAIHFVCIDWRSLDSVLETGKKIYKELKNICVWNKDNGGMGSFYRSKHEMICVFKSGTATHINNIELGTHGRYRTNVWDYPGLNSSKRGRLRELQMHPTIKPCALVIDAIKDCSHHGDLVLDPFGGSGTTIIAAEKSGRKARVIELDPLYVDVAIRRWEKMTRRSAVHANSKRTFAQVSKERAAPTRKGRHDA